MIRGAIFDIDGVLLDSMGIWEDLGARYLQSMGLVPEEGLNEILFSMSMEQGADYLKSHYMPDISSGEILQGIQNMLEKFYFEEVILKPGAKEIMEFLKERGIRMAAATSSPRIHVERALGRNGLLKYPEAIFTTGELMVSKQSPKIYNIAAAAIGTKPDETIVFEDSLYALKTARSAGFKVIGVYDAKGEKDQEGLRETADIYLTGPEEFFKNTDRLFRTE
ncbi:MAG: HAD family phosphatase [Lachnospiraceae bacterium]|nr:HAD family phosphatase [Lachnospiraceae bacterium]